MIFRIFAAIAGINPKRATTAAIRDLLPPDQCRQIARAAATAANKR